MSVQTKEFREEVKVIFKEAALKKLAGYLLAKTVLKSSK